MLISKSPETEDSGLEKNGKEELFRVQVVELREATWPMNMGWEVRLLLTVNENLCKVGVFRGSLGQSSLWATRH